MWSWKRIRVLALLPLVAASARGASVEEIVAAHLEARGGAERIRAVRSQLLTGRITTPHGVSPVRVEWRRPEAVRIELEIQGMKVIQAFDGRDGWKVIPMLGSNDPQRASDEEIAGFRRSADFDGPLLDAAEKGHRIELVGRETFEGTLVDRLRVTKADGEVVTLDLDAESHLLLREAGLSTVRGFQARYEVVYGAFREVDGVTIPFERERRTEGMPTAQVTTVESVQLDVALPDSRFAMPVGGGR